MTNLLTLATQIEQATEDQQQDMLDTAWRTMFPFIGGDQAEQSARWESWTTFSRMLETNAYESAAHLLRHPNAMWAVGNMEDGPFARLCWPQADGSFINGYHEGHASTPALALAAACCRAVAQMGEGDHG